MWSWEERLRQSGSQLEWTQSREYTSVILRDTSRRIMQRLYAIEKLECFEALIEIWESNHVALPTHRTNQQGQLASSVFDLLNILNGHKDSGVFSLFVDAIHSRASPASVEPANRSSLST